MAKVNIIGSAVVITSSVKLDDIKTIQKYRPNALVLMGGEDGKEPIFAVNVSNSETGTLSKYGAEFSKGTTDANGAAQITMAHSYGDDDLKESIADSLGASLILLSKWEESAPTILEEVAAERASVMANITIG